VIIARQDANDRPIPVQRLANRGAERVLPALGLTQKRRRPAQKTLPDRWKGTDPTLVVCNDVAANSCILVRLDAPLPPSYQSGLGLTVQHRYAFERAGLAHQESGQFGLSSSPT